MTRVDTHRTELARRARAFSSGLAVFIIASGLLLRWSTAEQHEWLAHAMLAPAGVSLIFGPLGVAEAFRQHKVVRNIDRNYLNPDERKRSGIVGFAGFVVIAATLYVVAAF